MRVASGAPLRNGGWLHRPPDDRITTQHRTPPTTTPKQRITAINWSALHRLWTERTSDVALRELAEKLGLTVESLRVTGCCRGLDAHRKTVWVWPMYDRRGHVCGFRCRSDDGAKYAYTGSMQGVFLPSAFHGFAERVYLVEGATDLCAAWTLGLNAIGRPSCRGCESVIFSTLRRLPVREVVIVADADKPGVDGAMALQQKLPWKSVVWVPPAKDLREMLRGVLSSGGTVETARALVESNVRSLEWRMPR